MAWLSDLAGKAEHFLNNLDEQTGAALRQHRNVRPNKFERYYPQAARKSPPKMLTKRLSVESTTFSPLRQHSSHVSPQTQPLSFTNSVNYDKPGRTQHRKHRGNNTKTFRDASSDMIDLKHCRRKSLPIDLEIITSEKKLCKVENLETENAVLRNELHIINQEITDLVEKLRMTEDGNNVDSSSEELKQTKLKLEMKERDNNAEENEYLSNQINELKQLVSKVVIGESKRHKREHQNLEAENIALKEQIKTGEKEIKDLNQKVLDQEKLHIKLENELRHANAVINELQIDVDRRKDECKRLEEDWDAYKVRVKGMLYAKDSEIKAMRDGLDLNEDCKVLTKQVDSLKEERQELTDILDRVHKENAEMKRYVELIESKNNSIDRTVLALRDALKEEHAARTQVETQYGHLQQELQAVQFETNQTISSLRAALRDKDNEITHLKSATTLSNDTSALNVADYTQETQESLDNEKISYLTQLLCKKQERIDFMLAENNMMKIQMQKLESKLKNVTMNNSRVINLQDSEVRVRPRTNISESSLSRFLLRMGLMITRYPLVRLLMVFYMIGLHFCVITVLVANTPDNYSSRPSKSLTNIM